MNSKVVMVLGIILAFALIAVFIIYNNRKKETVLIQPSGLQLQGSTGTLNSLLTTAGGLFAPKTTSTSTTSGSSAPTSDSGAQTAK